jgi:WD40 repeat protein
VLGNEIVVQSATFADAKRTWSTCPPDHLEHLVQASLAAGEAADAAKAAPSNLLLKAAEAVLDKQHNPENGGRTLQDAISLEGAEEMKKQSAMSVGSVFQRPVLLASEKERKNSSDEGVQLAESQLTKRSSEAAERMRRFLDIRDKFTKQADQLRTLKRSLEINQKNLEEANRQQLILKQSNGDFDEVTKLSKEEEIKENEQNSIRTIAQLHRQLSGLEKTHDATSNELFQAERDSRAAYRDFRHIRGNFRNPTGSANNSLQNRVLLNVYNRQTGLDRFQGCTLPRTIGRIRNSGTVAEMRKALVFHRLSHAATINTHLSYPVYCLRFDRTGRYFISGADDYLVRVFCVGSNVKVDERAGFGCSLRGAVLVCTLRGHAGVINDIALSPDNSFLATASEDGDCRVWGLKDGSPIALLRGHKGGANSVVWSATIPYRLVTTGGDGLARSWDIREACLKRYTKVIGKRPEYCLRLPESEKIQAQNQDNSIGRIDRETSPVVPPPPLPASQPQPDAGSLGQPQNAVPLPPLPPAVGNGAARVDAHPDVAAGSFVANDNIDEGVKLLTKFQHGTPQEIQVNGPGTRSRRSAVKVLCVAQCPHGKHFATGSDDGVCRIWREDEDVRVDRVDGKFSDWFSVLDKSGSHKPANSGKMQKISSEHSCL